MKHLRFRAVAWCRPDPVHALPARRAAAVIAIAWLLCMPAIAGAAPSGAAGLVGVWCNSNDGGTTCWAWDEFRADGRFSACGRTEDDPLPFFGEGRYGVDGMRMCYVVERASANFWLQPGGRYCTDILSVDARTHRYRDIDTGAEFTLLRVPPTARRCPPRLR